jgi:hypothetical protein
MRGVRGEIGDTETRGRGRHIDGLRGKVERDRLVDAVGAALPDDHNFAA